MRKRRTARVMVFDEAGRILLIRFVVPRADGEFIFWLTPGGEIEAGETPEQAAVRELQEELGLELVVTAAYEEANQFVHQGEMRDNVDYFFTAMCDGAAPLLTRLTPEEMAVMKEIRWWSTDEIQCSTERIFPVDLAVRIRAWQPRNLA